MKIILIGIIFSLLSISPSQAHHSGAIFNHTEIITLNGIIKELHFSPPHVLLDILIRTKTGSIELWRIEAESPRMMSRIGLNRKTLKAADSIIIRAHPLKNGRNGGSYIDIILDNSRFISSIGKFE